MKDKIRKAIEQNTFKYYGLRYADEYYELQCSRKWELGEPTENELSGLSVIQITIDTIEKTLNDINFYSNQGNYLFLIGSDEAYNGEDDNELVFDAYSHKLITEL